MRGYTIHVTNCNESIYLHVPAAEKKSMMKPYQAVFTVKLNLITGRECGVMQKAISITETEEVNSYTQTFPVL